MISNGHDYIFYFKSGKGLFKMSLGDGVSKTPGAIRESNTTKPVKEYKEVTMVCFQNKLYIRHEGIKPAPFEVWDCDTLTKD